MSPITPLNLHVVIEDALELSSFVCFYLKVESYMFWGLTPIILSHIVDFEHKDTRHEKNTWPKNAKNCTFFFRALWEKVPKVGFFSAESFRSRRVFWCYKSTN